MSQCNVTNKTFNALFVACKAGYDGGLRQTFIIEVYQGKYYDDFVRTASGTSTTPSSTSVRIGRCGGPTNTYGAANTGAGVMPANRGLNARISIRLKSCWCVGRLN